MSIAPALPADAHPVCADPKWLKLVDAAFKRPGGPAGKILAEHACGSCPVRADCLRFALDGGEHGPWGGTTANARTRRRGYALSVTYNLNGIRRDEPIVTVAKRRGDTAQVRAWARSVGIPVPPKGVPKRDVYDAYDEAHGRPRLGVAS